MFVGQHKESVDRGRVAHNVVEQVVAGQRVCFVRRDHVLGADRKAIEIISSGSIRQQEVVCQLVLSLIIKCYSKYNVIL